MKFLVRMVFFRKFTGNSTPEIEVQLMNNSSKNEAQLIFKKIKGNVSAAIEDLYEKSKKTISLHQSEKVIAIDLNKNKGWYDLKINIDGHLWHFAGRIETGKLSVTDPHWA
jgi:phospholipase C